ncbi:MAG TPA: glycoside hydrolase family 3 N-terminal domain-containing protein [Candidatus Nanopelagicales bacterium]
MQVLRAVRAGGVAVVLGSLLAGCSSASPAAAPATSPATAGAPGAGSPAPTPTSPTAGPAGPLACVAELPLGVRIGQTMLVTTTDLARVQPWLDDGLIAGLLASGVMSQSTAQAFDRATSGTRYGALLAADEEGGQVQRYRGLLGSMPSPQAQARSMTPEQVTAMWAEHAAALRDWGVDLVLAPVADVGHGPGVGSRSFSDDPEVVGRYATATAQGIRTAGLLPVLKHFPGHGRTTGDSHDEARVIGPELDELRAIDFQPFTEVLDAVGTDQVGVMVGHTQVPGTAEEAASQSPAVIEGMLREELGFDGLVVSDALGMAAAGQPTQGDALVGFLRAGGDLGIVGPGGSQEGRRAVRAALADGTLSQQRLDEAAATVLAAKGLDPCDLAAQGGDAAGADASPTPAEDGPPGSDPLVVNPTKEP